MNSKLRECNQLSQFTGSTLVEASPPPTIGHPPDMHRVLLNSDGQAIGACSIWWRHTPAYRDQSVGYVGHFWAEGSFAARQLLQQACRDLARAGCSLALGPIDGSTWNNYRAVTESSDAPPFFLEPQHPASLTEYFLENGFSSELNYFSALDQQLAGMDPLARRVAAEMNSLGITLRPFRLDDFSGELLRLHALATDCFRSHDLFSELHAQDFLRLYQPLRPAICPELILIAERDAVPLGFAFAVPDLFERQRTGAARTVILKTLGVLPDRATAGLGYHLLSEMRRQASAIGFQRMILALMRDTLYFSRRQFQLGTPFRRYGLFARKLSP
ncbi:MAG: GNAT family N-acetyltransferase [Planctomycetota bacterium]